MFWRYAGRSWLDNPNVLVLDADLANSTKADKFAIAYPERFLQMGIAEQTLSALPWGWRR